jgi:hypothetical protein|tara:strand:+ start:97 stop:309 length:213 start_codon:yes stop_codon:yes gene_type:complete
MSEEEIKVESNIKSVDFEPRMPQLADPDVEEAYAAYFAKGGTVTVYNSDARTEGAIANPWQRGKKKTEKK